MTPQSGNQVSTSLGNSGLCWTVFARNRDTTVPAEGNGDLQTLICVLVARPRQCPTLSNPVPSSSRMRVIYRNWSATKQRPHPQSVAEISPWQNWMAAYLGYTLWMKMLFCGWPIMVNDTHTRRRRLVLTVASSRHCKVDEQMQYFVFILSINTVWRLSADDSGPPSQQRRHNVVRIWPPKSVKLAGSAWKLTLTQLLHITQLL